MLYFLINVHQIIISLICKFIIKILSMQLENNQHHYGLNFFNNF